MGVKKHKPVIIPEAELLRFAIEALKHSSLVWFRVPVGGVAQSIGGGKIIYKKSPLKGFSDLAIITKQGVLSTLELKSKTKLTPEQKEWIFKLSNTNCNTCVARTQAEVLLYIYKLGGFISPAHLALVPGLCRELPPTLEDMLLAPEA